MNIFSTFANFQGKLRGMHEHSVNVTLPSAASDVKTVTQRIYQSANVLQVNNFQRNKTKSLKSREELSYR